MTTRILLLRHAKTAAPHLFHGAESDVGLGEEGHQQAESVATSLAEESPIAIYSSGMKRALQTAEPIGRSCRLPVTILPQLHERGMGRLSGTSWSETRPIHEQTMQAWESGDLDATHPTGESYQQMHDRILPAFLQMVRSHSGGVVVVVAHGMVIRVLVSTLIERIGRSRIQSIPIEHVGVFDLRLRGSSWTLEGY